MLVGSPWGSHVAFRVPLPDEVTANHRRGLPTLTKGPPRVLYVGVYQKVTKRREEQFYQRL